MNNLEATYQKNGNVFLCNLQFIIFMYVFSLHALTFFLSTEGNYFSFTFTLSHNSGFLLGLSFMSHAICYLRVSFSKAATLFREMRKKRIVFNFRHLLGLLSTKLLLKLKVSKVMESLQRLMRLKWC